MYVCLCNAVTDTQIRHAVLGGAARMRDLSNCLGVAADCGKCACAANAIRRETLLQIEEAQSLPDAA
ncbi:(2Fe-2S)-binding protein [Paludibacterium paludis]|nr:(2Fe-2S)-binding protein [Paludibacterium paludis]